MAGLEVSRQGIDQKVGESLLMLRQALDKSESIAKWIANQAVVNGEDPLVTIYGYDEDEAYLLRLVYEQIETLRTGSLELQETARKLTGLE